MTTYKLSIEDAPRAEDVQLLGQGLTAHALPHTKVPGFRPIGVFLRDEQNRIVGGVWGYINWNWLSIGLVWTDDALRGQGYGRRLIETLERVARERGCRYAHLDTFSYQARPFYEHLGYELFGTLDDYPPGHQRFFLKKKLAD
ncbi:MAG: GNAT family N-acetyltransferase [Blastocatellia bacterium]